MWILGNGTRIDIGYLYEKSGYIYWDVGARVKALIECNGGLKLKCLCKLKKNAPWRSDLTTAKLPLMHPLNIVS
jgi:hypothetical protein